MVVGDVVSPLCVVLSNARVSLGRGRRQLGFLPGTIRRGPKCKARCTDVQASRGGETALRSRCDEVRNYHPLHLETPPVRWEEKDGSDEGRRSSRVMLSHANVSLRCGRQRIGFPLGTFRRGQQNVPACKRHVSTRQKCAQGATMFGIIIPSL